MKLVRLYESINLSLGKLIRSLKYNNVSGSIDILKNLFLYIADSYKYIDPDIFSGLWTLKNDILSAETKHSFFMKSKFVNKSSLIDEAEIINKVIRAKKDELIDYVENVG